jgi:sugar lactone lactonase YvrE
MKQPNTILAVGCTLVVCVMSPAGAATMTLNPGDILVTDSQAAAVIRVDPVTGAQTVVSSFGNLVDPAGIAVAPSGAILVAEQHMAAPEGLPALLTVDATTGAQTVVSLGGLFESLRGVVINGVGDALVAQGDSSLNGIIQVDPATGAQSVISSGGSFQDPTGLALDGSGNLVVADQEGRAVIRVDPIAGSQTVVSSGGSFVGPTGLAIEASGSYVVADEQASTVFRVDAVTGAQTVVSSDGLFDHPFGIAIEADGNLIVVNAGTTRPGVIRVDPATGAQSVLTSGGSFQGPGFVAIVPRSLPDLREIRVFGFPRVSSVGASFTVSDSVVNSGTANAPTSAVRYFLSLDATPSSGDTELTGGRIVPALAPTLSSSGSADVTIPSGTSPGHYFVMACADGDHQILESNEANNCKASLRKIRVHR